MLQITGNVTKKTLDLLETCGNDLVVHLT
jgi:hypothetical protein